MDTLRGILSLPGRRKCVRTWLRVEVNLSDDTFDVYTFIYLSLLFGQNNFTLLCTVTVGERSLCHSINFLDVGSGPLSYVSNDANSSVETNTVLIVRVNEHYVGLTSPSNKDDDKTICDFRDCPSRKSATPVKLFLGKRRFGKLICSLQQNKERHSHYNHIIN